LARIIIEEKWLSDVVGRGSNSAFRSFAMALCLDKSKVHEDRPFPVSRAFCIDFIIYQQALNTVEDSQTYVTIPGLFHNS